MVTNLGSAPVWTPVLDSKAQGEAKSNLRAFETMNRVRQRRMLWQEHPKSPQNTKQQLALFDRIQMEKGNSLYEMRTFSICLFHISACNFLYIGRSNSELSSPLHRLQCRNIIQKRYILHH